MASTMEKTLVLAINFGTTSKGYAYSYIHEYYRDPTEVHIDQPWCIGSVWSLKQPTCILCKPDLSFDSFGFDAECKYRELADDNSQKYWFFFRRFNMVLQDEQVNARMLIEDETGKNAPAIKIFGMAIRYYKDCVQRRLNATGTDEIHWVFPVPTIGILSAKQFMREAANEAGIGVNNLTIVMESEAASIYCQLCLPHYVSNDTRHIVLDLGDEMTNITVHEKESGGNIKVVHTFCDKSTGSVTVDEEFNKMMITIFGANTFKRFCKENNDDYMEMLREIEYRKKSIKTDHTERISFKVPAALQEAYNETTGGTVQEAIRQTHYSGKIQCISDIMRLDADVFRSLFQNCIGKICDCLTGVLEQPGVEGTSTFLMVGELSECQLMQEAMKKAFPLANVIIPNDANNAVLKGAVMFGHKSCGVRTVLPYEIRRMDEQSQQLYREALSAGTKRVHNIRVMIIGHLGVGKTALAKRLLNKEVIESDRESTEGIEIHDMRCEIDLGTGEWRTRKDDVLDPNIQSIADILIKHALSKNSKAKEDSSIPRNKNVISYKDKETTGSEPDFSSKLESRTKQKRQPQTDTSSLNETAQKELPSLAKDGLHDPNVKGLIRSTSKTLSYASTNQKGHARKPRKNLEEIENVVRMERFLTPSNKDVSYVTILDFAGQFLFYTTHQAFMSWRTIYLLVTDIRLPLTHAVEEDQSGTALSGNKTRQVHEYVSYWLNSVHSHVKKRHSKGKDGGRQGMSSHYTPVILVATHADKIPKETIAAKTKSYFDSIRRKLSNSILKNHLADEDFAISNLGLDSNIEDLKEKIFHLAQKQDYWGEPIPARWFPLEQVLLEMKRRGVLILDYTEVENLNQTRQVKIESAEELVLFLQFQHDVGNIVFFDTEKLKRKIVLDPQWLIRGVTTLITSDQVIKRCPELSAQWYEFKDTGRLTRKLIDLLWSQHEEFDDNKEHLLGVLEQLNIIAKPITKTGDSEEEYYWVPCMVHATVPENMMTTGEKKGVTKTSTLCFVSKTQFIHVGVFHRLLVTCLSRWKPAKSGERYFVFVGLCVFQLDNCHELMLSLKDFIIQATVTRYTCRGDKPDLSICIEVKEYLNSALSDISKYLCPNTEFEIYITCSSSPLQSDGDRHKIGFLQENKGKEIRCISHARTHPSAEELLKYWEECLESDGKPGECSQLLSERLMNDLAGKLGSEWCSVAIQLGLGWTEVQQIQLNNPGNVRYQIFMALLKWSQGSDKDDRGKIEELLVALRKVNRTDLTKQLEETFHL